MKNIDLQENIPQHFQFLSKYLLHKLRHRLENPSSYLIKVDVSPAKFAVELR